MAEHLPNPVGDIIYYARIYLGRDLPLETYLFCRDVSELHIIKKDWTYGARSQPSSETSRYELISSALGPQTIHLTVPIT